MQNLPEAVTVPPMIEQPTNRLKELREAKGLERHDVCAHLRGCRLPASEDTVRRLERSEELIPTKYFAALVELLDCSLEQLLGWDRDDTRAAA